MNIRKYQAFVKTAEYASFTKAAKDLRCTQSGVSRMISDLENELGVTLLDRSRAGVSLTSEGVELLPYMQRICSEDRNMLSHIQDLHGLEGGLIRVGTFSSIATHWLPNMIRHFEQAYPKIDFELQLGDYGEIENWVTQGKVDFGFLPLTGKMELETRVVERDRFLVVMPKQHPLAGLDRIPPKELENYPFMLLEKGGKTEISAILDRFGLRPKIRFTTWDDYAIMAMVEHGLGVSILPELILRRVPYRIVARELEQPAYRELGIAMRSYETLPLAVKKFLEYLPCRWQDAE
ncbi:MAG: LysR family transcriptional regulator [Oscillospiraceae bacterium]|nr:LysR family transcriptional regulator [Oscillospiraceae bacterium]